VNVDEVKLMSVAVEVTEAKTCVAVVLTVEVTTTKPVFTTSVSTPPKMLDVLPLDDKTKADTTNATDRMINDVCFIIFIFKTFPSISQPPRREAEYGGYCRLQQARKVVVAISHTPAAGPVAGQESCAVIVPVLAPERETAPERIAATWLVDDTVEVSIDKETISPAVIPGIAVTVVVATVEVEIAPGFHDVLVQLETVVVAPPAMENPVVAEIASLMNEPVLTIVAAVRVPDRVNESKLVVPPRTDTTCGRKSPATPSNNATPNKTL